jgi:hypothetical protein
MPRKEFESFTRLDASDVNTYLMDQSVMTFGGTAARGSAIPTPVEGMVTYLNDIDSLSVYNGTAFTTDRTIQVFAGTAARGSAIGTAVEGMYTHINETDTLEFYDGSAWVATGGGGKILQVVSAVKTDVFSTTLATGGTTSAVLSATITPTSSNSKILIMVSACISASTDSATLVVFRGGSALSGITGDAVGDRRRVSTSTFNISNARAAGSVSVVFLDSPATTSATTYDIRLGHGSAASQTISMNRTAFNDDVAADSRQASTITLFEVAN